MSISNKSDRSSYTGSSSYSEYFSDKFSKDPGFTITSLIDIFTILIIFLLKSYSAAGFTLPLTPGINLPNANFSSSPVPAAVISVTNQYILIDGREILVPEKRAQLKDNDITIKELKAELNRIKENIIESSELNKGIKFTGRVIIEGDKSIPFELLQSIMYTCGQSGYDKISLAIIKEGKKA